MKREKIIDKALAAIGFECDDSDWEFPIRTERHIDETIEREKGNIKERELGIYELKALIARYEEDIKIGKENIDNWNALKHQIKIEKFKALNPGITEVY